MLLGLSSVFVSSITWLDLFIFSCSLTSSVAVDKSVILLISYPVLCVSYLLTKLLNLEVTHLICLTFAAWQDWRECDAEHQLLQSSYSNEAMRKKGHHETTERD